MGLRGKKISKKSQEIVKLIEKGTKSMDIIRMGYPISTVMYYVRKIKKPAKYRKFIKTISKYNNRLSTD